MIKLNIIRFDELQTTATRCSFIRWLLISRLCWGWELLFLFRREADVFSNGARIWLITRPCSTWVIAEVLCSLTIALEREAYTRTVFSKSQRCEMIYNNGTYKTVGKLCQNYVHDNKKARKAYMFVIESIVTSLLRRQVINPPRFVSCLASRSSVLTWVVGCL